MKFKSLNLNFKKSFKTLLIVSYQWLDYFDYKMCKHFG